MSRNISWMLVILWMALIFLLSAQPANVSSNLSQRLTEKIIETVKKIVPKVEIDKNIFNHILRKKAHYFSYLVLGVLVLNAFKRTGFNKKKSVGLAFVLCVLYAISDEIHQLFVPGRGGQVTDVLIDTAGICTGIALYLLVDKFLSELTG